MEIIKKPLHRIKNFFYTSPVDKFVFAIVVILFALAASSSVVIFLDENISISFSKDGFEFFLKSYSFPIKSLSSSIAVLSVWAVIRTFQSTKRAFMTSYLMNEIYRCESEINEILSLRIEKEEIVNRIKYGLNHVNKNKVMSCFESVVNKDLSVDEIVPHLAKFDIKERHKVFHILTENLSLRLQRYTLAVYELDKIVEEKYASRYYATKYIALMKDLYKFGSKIDPELIVLSSQLSERPISYRFNYKSISGEKSEDITRRVKRNLGI